MRPSGFGGRYVGDGCGLTVKGLYFDLRDVVIRAAALAGGVIECHLGHPPKAVLLVICAIMAAAFWLWPATDLTAAIWTVSATPVLTAIEKLKPISSASRVRFAPSTTPKSSRSSSFEERILLRRTSPNSTASERITTDKANTRSG
jgi:hypothetical protein